MKRIIFILSLFVFLITELSSQTMPWIDKRPWSILFEDNCNSFNSTLWRKNNNITHGVITNGSEEPQIYTSDNVYMQNGKMVFRLRRETTPLSHPASYEQCQYNNEHYYTSGEIQSLNKYSFGYYEIYAKLPVGAGFWPAFWFHDSNMGENGNWYNEIDVFEGDGANPDSLTSGVWISPLYSIHDTLRHRSFDTIPFDYTTGYHWYGVKWDKCGITWYFDRIPVNDTVNNFDFINYDISDTFYLKIEHPMNLLINLAAFPTNWAYESIESNPLLPNYMYVDQINGYVLDCREIDRDINEIPDFSTYSGIKKSVTLSGASVLPTNENTIIYYTDFVLLQNGFTVPLGTSFGTEFSNACDCQ